MLYPTSLFESYRAGIISREYFIKALRSMQMGGHRINGGGMAGGGTYLRYRGRTARAEEYGGRTVIEWRERGNAPVMAVDTVAQFVDAVNLAEAGA